MVAALCLAAWGAGCTPDSPVSLDKYQNAQAQSEALGFNALDVSQGESRTERIEDQAQQPPVIKPEETAPAATNTKPMPNENQQTTTTPAGPAQPEPLAFPGIMPEKETANRQVRLKTTQGEIVFELLPKEGPRAVSNFIYLTKEKFYDGIVFHRVVPGFVIQAGDPLTKDPNAPRQSWGTGGPGYEFEDDKVKLPYSKGIVAMANHGRNTNGSQFFIMLEDSMTLDPNYSIFGRVTKGLDVVSKIQIGDKILSATVEAKK
jgi:cyclophilin family peptidyl-prolyl cis-trans isomerase